MELPGANPCTRPTGLGRVGKHAVPPGKKQHARVALQGSREHLRTFDTESNTIILDCRDRRLRDARERGELILAQLLQLPQGPDRFANRDLDAPFCRTKFLDPAPPVIMGRQGQHQYLDLGSLDTVDHSPLEAESAGPMSDPLP